MTSEDSTPVPPDVGHVLDQAYRDRAAGQAANIAAHTSALCDCSERVERAVAVHIRSGHPFTANSVHSTAITDGGDELCSNLPIASWMGKAARAGDIVEVLGRPLSPSLRRSRHGSRLRWWIAAAAADCSEEAA